MLAHSLHQQSHSCHLLLPNDWPACAGLDPAPRPVPVARGKTACLLIRFLIEFLPPFLHLVNPCTGLWADDWRVITGCWHVCFLWASLLILLTATAAKSLFFVDLSLLSAPTSLLPSASYLLPPISSPFLQLSLSVLPAHSIHISEKISLPRGNLESGSQREGEKNLLYFLFRIKRKGMGPPFSIL